MSDENFFARWSRRKAEAAKVDADKRIADNADHASTPQPTAAAANASDSEGQHPAQPDGAPSSSTATVDIASFDPKDLPPIDSIGPDTDVSMFLRPGVPADLARAALRRAWTADPAIRDYIGLSENSWDFTAPQGVPGFAPLSPEDAQRLLAAFTGRTPVPATAQAAEVQSPLSGDETQNQPQSDESAVGPTRNQFAAVNREDTIRTADQLEACTDQLPLESSRSEDTIVAVQHIHPDPMRLAGKSPPRRGGRALPK
ncbi:MAG TPA: DUF3306 domain-containing protein [Xanthobacteraceae bacterium]|nr:DUF3306 domain-containing protein [Xanthobacteraceae bacterium]